MVFIILVVVVFIIMVIVILLGEGWELVRVGSGLVGLGLPRGDRHHHGVGLHVEKVRVRVKREV